MTTYNLKDIEEDNFEDLREISRFSKYSDIELIETFNKEVGNKGWASARAEFLAGIHNEFNKRGFDYSEIGDEKSLSFKNIIKLIDKTIKIQ